jgi:FkbM family methyltransferase
LQAEWRNISSESLGRNISARCPNSPAVKKGTFMLETLHRVGSRLRHSPFLEEQRWLWETLEPTWQRMFKRFSAERGYPAHINDDIFRLVYSYGSRYDRADKREYEPDIYNAFVKDISEGTVVFDIGAHVGFFTLAASKRVGRRGFVYAFEPAPETAAILKQHVSFNEWRDHTEVVTSVISDAIGTVSFFAYGDSMASSMREENWELAAEHRTAPVSKIEVPSVTLDAFCKERRVKPDVLKIDVEGAELLVLRGATEFLKNNSPIIHCEVHPPLMKHFNYSVEDFMAHLDKFGYKLERLDEPNPLGIFHSRITRR